MSTLQPINESIIICDECEAVWPSNATSITNTNFEDFTTYIHQLGYTYDEISLIEINYNWLQYE